MSRSNPNENGSNNPTTRWFEWSGETGVVRYYDKERKENIEVGPEFGFVLLDQLGSVRGWHEQSQSGIYSNEVKDTRQDAMVVKAFKGGTLAEGIYKDIKDRVNAAGGKFHANCYIAFKNDEGVLTIGSLRLKGAALGAWMEFTKANRADIYRKGIRIKGFTEGKHGRVTFRVPTFSLVELSDASNAAATALDVTLQAFLRGYLKKNTRDQAEAAPQAHDDLPPPDDADYRSPGDLTDDDIPF
jgi:hypothetical protein